MKATAQELMCVNSFASKNSAEMLLAVDSDCRHQILECWRDLDFARGGSNTYELFTDGKKNDKLLTDAIKKCREDIEGCLGMLCKRGALRYWSGSSTSLLRARSLGRVASIAGGERVQRAVGSLGGHKMSNLEQRVGIPEKLRAAAERPHRRYPRTRASLTAARNPRCRR